MLDVSALLASRIRLAARGNEKAALPYTQLSCRKVLCGPVQV